MFQDYQCNVCTIYLLGLGFHGPISRYVTLWVASAPGMPGTFSPPPGVSDPDMHHGTWIRDTMCGKTMMQSWN